MIRNSVLLLAALALMLSGGVAVRAQEPEAAKTPAVPAKPKGMQLKLELSDKAMDKEARAKNHMMYMPGSFALVDEKPAAIAKEPAYKATPKYGAFQMGNGPRSVTYFAVDEPKGEKGKLYVDLNQNGDLTDDGPGDWDEATEKDGTFNYNSNVLLHASWGSAIKEDESGNYSVWMYKRHGDSRGGFVRNSGRTGTLQVGEKSFPCLLLENTNDAIFTVPANLERTRRPVQLMIDLNGDGLFTGMQEKVDDKTVVTKEVYSLSEPFNLDGQWWIARPSIGGSNLIVIPSTPPGNATAAAQQPTERPSLLAAGATAPDFTVSRPDGKPLKLSDFKGKVVVLDFWATWCGPCKASMPGLQKIYDSVHGQEVVVLSLNVWDEKDAYDAWIEANSGKVYSFVFGFDPAGRDKEKNIPAKYNVSGIPTMYIIDREGKIATAILGSGNEENIVKALDGQGIKAKVE